MSATPSLTNVRQVIDELDDLSDTQTIRLLERHTPYREGSHEADVDEAIRVIKPEDTQSMQAIKSDVKRNAPVLFAVQLDWSVTPFDMAKVPPLAIFNAYTLYTTEANREGRTWYGLRLGFFSDAVSAKQVAYYVRSDFKTVSVVPVTTIEKERATDLNAARSGIHSAANIKEVAGADAAVHALVQRQRRLQAARGRHAGADRAGRGRRDVAALQQAGARQAAAPSAAAAARRGRRAAGSSGKASKARKPGAARRQARCARAGGRRDTRPDAGNSRRAHARDHQRQRRRHRRAPSARQDRQEGLEVRLADRSPVGQEVIRARDVPVDGLVPRILVDVVDDEIAVELQIASRPSRVSRRRAPRGDWRCAAFLLNREADLENGI